MDAQEPGLTAMGTGILGRWRENLGNQLDHDILTIDRDGTRDRRRAVAAGHGRFGYPDSVTATADQLVDAQYAGRHHLRPIYDAILDAATR